MVYIYTFINLLRTQHCYDEATVGETLVTVESVDVLP